MQGTHSSRSVHASSLASSPSLNPPSSRHAPGQLGDLWRLCSGAGRGTAPSTYTRLRRKHLCLHAASSQLCGHSQLRTAPGLGCFCNQGQEVWS